MVINAMSFSDVSEMAIVPDSECRMPTLIGPLSCACANGTLPASASAPDIEPNFNRLRRFMCFPLPFDGDCLWASISASEAYPA